MLGLVRVRGCSPTLLEALQDPPWINISPWEKSATAFTCRQDTRLSQFSSGEKQLARQLSQSARYLSNFLPHPP